MNTCADLENEPNTHTNQGVRSMRSMNPPTPPTSVEEKANTHEPIRGTEWEQAPTRKHTKVNGYNIYNLTDKLVRLSVLDAGPKPQTAMPNPDFMQRLREGTLRAIKEHPRRTLQNNFTHAILQEIITRIPPQTVFRNALIVALTDMAYRYITYVQAIEKAKRAEVALPKGYLIQVWLQAWLKGEVPIA
jgi:hypothetical protein